MPQVSIFYLMKNKNQIKPRAHTPTKILFNDVIQWVPVYGILGVRHGCKLTW